MKHFSLFAALLIASGFCLAPGAQAAQLQVNANGQLTGALGVEVMGELYDVEFVDGTCAQVFDGCEDESVFTLVGDWADFIPFSEAIRDQILLDVALGSFDTNPSLVRGCEGAEDCVFKTPTEITDIGRIRGTSYRNDDQPANTVGYGLFNSGPGVDTTNSDSVWARWTVSAAPVPVPGALWLFASALVFVIHRKR